MSKTYVTVLSTDHYLPGVMALQQSLLNVGATYPLLVVVSEGLQDATLLTLQQLGMYVCAVPALAYHEDVIERMTQNAWPIEVIHSATKLQILSLVEYEKIVYLDADMIVRANLDHLFDKPHGSAVWDWCGQSQMARHQGLNSGLLVIEPNVSEYQAALALMNAQVGYDQDVFRALWPHWMDSAHLQLEPTLNVFVMGVEDLIKMRFLAFKDIQVLHYVGNPKPFQIKTFDLSKTLEFLNYLYWEYVNQAYLRLK